MTIKIGDKFPAFELLNEQSKNINIAVTGVKQIQMPQRTE